MADVGMIEHSPARSPWASDSAFIRSRFIVRRLKRMRTKARSMHDAVNGNYSGFCYTPTSENMDASSCVSYESVYNGSTPSQPQRTEVIATPRLQEESQQHKAQKTQPEEQIPETPRKKEVTPQHIQAEVVFVEEYTEPLDSNFKLCRARRAIASDKESSIEETTERKERDDASFSTADFYEYNFLQVRDEDMNLLEAIERSLPKEYSLRKRLYCPYSVTMYRTLLRLNQQPRFARPHQEHRRSFSLKNVGAYIESELQRLKVELMVQQFHVDQARRALEVSMMNRAGIREHLEAEKTLLLASTRQTKAHEEMEKWQRLQCLDNNVFFEEESGCAIVKGISISLDDTNHWSSYYFILVAVERDNVKGTELSTPKAECVHFTTHLHFSNLRPDFRITFYLYAITIKDPKFKFFHRSNERLNFLGRSSKPKWRNSLIEGLEHNFKLIGISEVQSPDFNKSNLNLTTMVPHLPSRLTMNLQGAVYLDTRHTGFLDIRYTQDGQHGMWTKYWFRLSGMDMHAWKDPSDVGTKDPAHQIPLSQCISREATPVDRFTCLRPYTFGLDLSTVNSEQQVLCSADSIADMEAWCYHISTMLRASRLWKTSSNCS